MDWPAFSTEDTSWTPFSSTRPHSISPACYPSASTRPTVKIQGHPCPIAGAQPSGQMLRPSRARLRLSASLSRSHGQKGLVTDHIRTFGNHPLPHACKVAKHFVQLRDFIKWQACRDSGKTHVTSLLRHTDHMPDHMPVLARAIHCCKVMIHIYSRI
jgi:hypothetical protein